MIAQNKSGDTNVSLDSVVVIGKTVGKNLRTTENGGMLWDMRMMNDLPKILGNADPIHYSQMLPGISINGEYDAGLHVLGCENSHNYVSIDGAPIFGASHLLGLFSIFNAAHFGQMSLQKSVVSSSCADRLGAELLMKTYAHPTDTLTGEVAIGLISSQGTIRIPVRKGGELAVSLRGSYLNLLYSSLLKSDVSSLKYSFSDANVTYNQILDSKNRILFNFYFGNDDATLTDERSLADFKLKWGNVMGSIKWLHDNGIVCLSDNVYFTRNQSSGDMSMQTFNVTLPSYISELGNKFDMRWKGWTSGMDFSLYKIEPQIPVINSTFMKSIKDDTPIDNSTLLALYLDREFQISKTLKSKIGIRGTWYHINDNNYTHLSPSANLIWQPRRQWNVSLSYSFRHQYLVQTGMSSINTPMEFWLGSGTYGLEPQAAHSVIMTGRYTTEDGAYCISMEVYSKWLTNQTEYNGTIYSFVTTSYKLEDMLLHGTGHNYGGNVMVVKNSGWLTGWLTYAYSRAMRTYNSEMLCGTFPSSHERLHEIDGVVTFHIGKHIDIGLTGVWATGTPFTAPKQYYIVNRRLIANYAEHNSNNLRPYFRLDGSMNYKFKRTRHIYEHGLNLSVYNLTARENDLFYYMQFDDEHYVYQRLTFFMRVLPSVSYYMKF